MRRQCNSNTASAYSCHVVTFSFSTPPTGKPSSSPSSYSSSTLPARPLSHNCLPVNLSTVSLPLFFFFSAASSASSSLSLISSISLRNSNRHFANVSGVTGVPWNFLFSSLSAASIRCSCSSRAAACRSAMSCSAESFNVDINVKTIAMPMFSSMVSLRLESSCSLSDKTSKYGYAGAVRAGKISRMGGSSGYSSGYRTCKVMVGGSESSPSSFVTSKVIEIRYSDSDISVTSLEDIDKTHCPALLFEATTLGEGRDHICNFYGKGSKYAMISSAFRTPVAKSEL